MQAHHTAFLQLLNGEIQYVVPRWQRRYCWDESDIGRLVHDLLAIASTDRPGAAHYGGALLTFPEPTPPGGVPTYRVVDGQQRLTTISIVLACIAESLKRSEDCDWTPSRVKKHLINDDVPLRKRLKLRLQEGDEGEYRRGLEGNPGGPGAVAQAWRIARRLVARAEVASLLQGIERFRVVSITLDATDDPQQIFESLNATGRPLTESEKVKNWLLMGLPDEEQQDLHDNHWIEIERKLGVERTTEPVDTFLRDFLRWRIGRNLGITRVHEELRRWAVREGRDQDRPALCRELARLAGLYGLLTGTAGHHSNARVRRALRHLRAMGIHTHRPFALRLLDDVTRGSHSGATHDALATTLAGVGTWITRLWLANRAMAGLNTAATELAYGPGPEPDAAYSAYWLARIRRLRNTRVGVPADDEVRDGVRNRKAYGGSATRSSFAMLCALMEREHGPESPARGKLTIEHVMPRKLTDDWKRDLGDDAQDLHGRWRDRLANLTLSGDTINSGMGAAAFAVKREVYAHSTVGMTRQVGTEKAWNVEALERRAHSLADLALESWPWTDRGETRPDGRTVPLKWRIGDGPWCGETAASQMVLHVAGALLGMDPANAEKLSGDAISSNLHSASRYPPGTQAGTLTMRAVPGHDDYVLYPYRRTYQESADSCRTMGERCGIKVIVRVESWNPAHAFWEFFKANAGGVSGQTTAWRSATQRTAPVNAFGDRIRVHAGKELLRLDIVVGKPADGGARAQRVRDYSRKILTNLSDQLVVDDPERREQDCSASVVRNWTRDDKTQWEEAARWMRDQHDRLLAIAEQEGGTFVSAAESDFLKSCDDCGKAVFSRILEWARSRSLSIRWGAKGFSVGVDIDAGRVVVCYAYPPDSVYGQSLYTALHNRAGMPKTGAPQEAVRRLLEAAKETGLFAPAARELKAALDRDLSLEQVDALVAWCESVESAIIEHEP